MPLRVLVLWNSPNLRGLRMLAGIPALERLVLPWLAEATPTMNSSHRRPANPSTLRQIGAESTLIDTAASTSIPGRDEFFREWDRVAGWRLAVHRQGGEVKVSRVNGGESRIEIKGRAVHDLSALRG